MRCHSISRPERRNAFTLVELLVVIAILSVLIALSIGSVFKARLTAVRVQCAGNLHQIGVAMTSYALSNKGRFPTSSHVSGYDYKKSWLVTLKPYLDSEGVVPRTYVSPADPRKDDRLAVKSESQISSSYVLNKYVGSLSPSAYNNLFVLKSPRDTIILFTGSDTLPLSVFSDHVHCDQWFRPPQNQSWARFVQEVQADRFGGLGVQNPAQDRTIGQANYLFADGHVETISAEEMKRRCDAGIDFATP